MKRATAVEPQKESPTLKKETVLSSETKVGSRNLLLVVQAYMWLPRGLNCGAVWVEPFAVVVIEEDGEYVLSLSSQPVTLEDLLLYLPALEAMIENARVNFRMTA